MAAIDEQVNEAFRAGGDRKIGEDEATFNARNSAAARQVYDLTRSLGLQRQSMAEAPPWKAPAGIPLNAFAKRRLAGLLGEGLPGYPFDSYGRERMANAKPKRKAKRTACPHCGGSLKEAA
jgi:hypothetical protein